METCDPPTHDKFHGPSPSDARTQGRFWTWPAALTLVLDSSHQVVGANPDEGHLLCPRSVGLEAPAEQALAVHETQQVCAAPCSAWRRWSHRICLMYFLITCLKRLVSQTWCVHCAMYHCKRCSSSTALTSTRSSDAASWRTVQAKRSVVQRHHNVDREMDALTLCPLPQGSRPSPSEPIGANRSTPQFGLSSFARSVLGVALETLTLLHSHGTWLSKGDVEVHATLGDTGRGRWQTRHCGCHLCSL